MRHITTATKKREHNCTVHFDSKEKLLSVEGGNRKRSIVQTHTGAASRCRKEGLWKGANNAPLVAIATDSFCNDHDSSWDRRAGLFCSEVFLFGKNIEKRSVNTKKNVLYLVIKRTCLWFVTLYSSAEANRVRC